MVKINLTHIETPVGAMIACATDTGVCLLEFTERKKMDSQMASMKKLLNGRIEEKETPILENLKNELSEYFAGKRQQFTVPLIFAGTEFQKKVWNELLKIPYGKTISYKQEAINMGHEKAVRAVANANGCNKISIIVPCHRVIGSDGSLTGYASGVERKQWLLNHEKKSMANR